MYHHILLCKNTGHLLHRLNSTPVQSTSTPSLSSLTSKSYHHPRIHHLQWFFRLRLSFRHTGNDLGRHLLHYGVSFDFSTLDCRTWSFPYAKKLSSPFYLPDVHHSLLRGFGWKSERHTVCTFVISQLFRRPHWLPPVQSESRSFSSLVNLQSLTQGP